MLLEEQSPFIVNHTEHRYNVWAVRTSQETHYVSATELSRLMLFGERSLFIVRTARNTQVHCVGRKHVSDTELSRLMLFGEQTLFIMRTIWNTHIHCVGRSYLTVNTLLLRYRAQTVNA
jgi:hypothetical protein